MPIYYPSGCDDNQSDHFCSNCPEPENGRVRSVFFYKKSAVWVDRSDPAEWTTKIESGDVILIPFTSGSFDGGTPKIVNGYGDNKSRTLSSTFKLQFKDPVYIENRNFYNDIKDSSNYCVGFRTSTQCHFFDVATNIAPKNPVADDLESEIVWDVECEMTMANLPIIETTPTGIFDACSAVS